MRNEAIDWFEKITGFREGSYEETKSKLRVEDGRLHTTESDRAYGIGEFSLPALSDLRAVNGRCDGQIRLTVRSMLGDAQSLHQDPGCAGAVFQVASQLNMLEMIDPGVTPEDGVTRYQYDMTQGPACAIAAGAATIYRNYLVPVAGMTGQTASRQINALTGVESVLRDLIGEGPAWKLPVLNGYALPDRRMLTQIHEALLSIDEREVTLIQGALQIGLHEDVEVTIGQHGQRVTQVFCSAMPLAYSDVPDFIWGPFARLILEASYEATLLCAVKNMLAGRSNKVLLTAIGGGVFGNDLKWIAQAVERALTLVRHHPLEVVLVSRSSVPEAFRKISQKYPSA